MDVTAKNIYGQQSSAKIISDYSNAQLIGEISSQKILP